MLGAIAGDVLGSVYEWNPVKTKSIDLFHPKCHFTDDTVLTIAVADAILNGKSYQQVLHDWGRRYPGAGYGSFFAQWLAMSDPQPYNSFGNGSAMRVSPVGFAFDDEARVLEEARRSAEATHNHPEGIKGAQATALCIWMARQKKDKDKIRQEIQQRFGYSLDQTLAEIRPDYHFDETCPGTVPQAIIAFLESQDFEDAIRNAISLGGDSDTLACITGGIAEAYYEKIPEEIRQFVLAKLPEEFQHIIHEFYRRYLPQKARQWFLEL